MPRKAQNERRKVEMIQEIDENLRRVYQETLSQEVPDRFRDLLEALRKKELDS